MWFEMFFLYDGNLLMYYFFIINLLLFTLLCRHILVYWEYNVLYDAIIFTLELPGTDIIPFLETLSCT